MDALATLLMWGLAGVTVVAFGAHYVRRSSGRAGLHDPLSSPALVAEEADRDKPACRVNAPVELAEVGSSSQPLAKHAETALEQPVDAPNIGDRSLAIAGPSTDAKELAQGANSPESALEDTVSTIEVPAAEAIPDVLPTPDLTCGVASLLAEGAQVTAESPVGEEKLAADDLNTNQTAAQSPIARQARRRQSVHRDRRAQKRTQIKAAPLPTPSEADGEGPISARGSAEVRLRLELHPIRETVQLAMVLSKPEGYPDTCMISLNGGTQLYPYDETRYDDVDVAWLPDTLANEFRITAPGGFTWIRSARRLHIFSSSATEPGLVSVSAAALGVEHTIVCRTVDGDFVREIAEATESPTLQNLSHWQGIPSGWCVLAGFRPRRSAEGIATGEFSSLDPLYDLKIEFVGGLQLRSYVFAEGDVPRITLPPLPDRVSVEIDGKVAQPDETGGWQAEGWDTVGPHRVDVLPGPSRSYEIVADPARRGGWPRWQIEAAWQNSLREPWRRTSICGASILGVRGEAVIAHETTPVLIALGSRGRATPLQRRMDADVSIGLPPEPPAFLLAASGPRRHQGAIVWLGLETHKDVTSATSAELSKWASIVRSAASRRLSIQSNGSSEAEASWQRATRRARDFKRRTA